MGVAWRALVGGVAVILASVAEAGEREAGFQASAVLKVDTLRTVSGRIPKTTKTLTNLDINLSYSAPGWNAFAHVLDNRGGQPNRHVAAAQGIDNIEVEHPATKLFQAWLEYAPEAWLGGSLKVGLYDLNSEFYATDSSSLFLHPAFGIGAELAQTGESGPSIFPDSSLGARLAYAGDSAYAQVVLLDAVPGDPERPRLTRVKLEDGTLAVAEAGWKWTASEGDDGAPGKLGLGAWRYSRPFARWDGAGESRNQGVYVLAEHPLSPDGRWRGFVRAGTAAAGINQFDRAFDLGIVWRDAFGRPGDEFGVGLAYEHNSHHWLRAVTAAGEQAPPFEMAYELSYRHEVNRWLAVQPDLQVVRNHGQTPAARATVAGIRVILRWGE